MRLIPKQAGLSLFFTKAITINIAKNNQPMSNLFVQMLHRMGIEADEFGSSTSASLPGLV